jgi:hypothetical protein
MSLPAHPGSDSEISTAFPKRPDLVLRLGFAGNRELPSEGVGTRGIQASIREVLSFLGSRLVELAPGTVSDANSLPWICRFYSDARPRLRLITGLAEGADLLAANALREVQSGELSSRLHAELAAVVPFDLDVYRRSRDAIYQPAFDEMVSRCTYVVSVDGLYGKPDPDSAAAQECRARAYRGQASLLLRQCDLLIAVADPAKGSRPGGTLETIRRAIAIDVAVIFIHAKSGQVRLIEPARNLDLSEAFSDSMSSSPDWREPLRLWVDNIVADAGTDFRGSGSEGEKVLREYFGLQDSTGEVSGHNRKLPTAAGVRGLLWSAFMKRFKPAQSRQLVKDAVVPSFARFRERATQLNTLYSGLYRGAFLLNYLLAVFAVLFATLSLVLIGYLHSPPATVVHSQSGQAASMTAPAGNPPPELPPHGGLLWTLFGLGLLKLGFVWTIYRNTHQANHGDWNDKAVDFRYLAERLRTMFYLPRLGSFQPPSPRPPRGVSRLLRQSAVDWLFEALVRSVSPAEVALDLPHEGPARPTKAAAPVLLKVEPKSALSTLLTHWIGRQADYHQDNAASLERMHRALDLFGARLSKLVIVFVAIDVILVSGELTHALPKQLEHFIQLASPWLIFLAALLPAAVAGLNGVQFQTECKRLSEVSAAMQLSLKGRASDPAGSHRDRVTKLIERMDSFRPPDDPGAWTDEALAVVENVAEEFNSEVSDWSVLYTKVVPEP